MVALSFLFKIIVTRFVPNHFFTITIKLALNPRLVAGLRVQKITPFLASARAVKYPLSLTSTIWKRKKEPFLKKSWKNFLKTQKKDDCIIYKRLFTALSGWKLLTFFLWSATPINQNKPHWTHKRDTILIRSPLSVWVLKMALPHCFSDYIISFFKF